MRGTYGAAAVRPYGDTLDVDDTGFTIEGVPATFSVIIGPETPGDHYDVQIESLPPGDYIHMATVEVREFEALVKRIASSPRERWPGMER